MAARKKRVAKKKPSLTTMVPDRVRSAPMRGAWRKGWLAGKEGTVARTANPYANDDTREVTRAYRDRPPSPARIVTFRRGLARMWDEGYGEGEAARWREAGQSARETLPRRRP